MDRVQWRTRGRARPDYRGRLRKEVVAVGIKPERDLVKVLTNIVEELRDLQAAGRMRDPESRAHVEFLERGLRRAEERVASPELAGSSGGGSGSAARRRMVS